MRDIRSIIRRILLSVFVLALIVGTGAFYLVLHDRAVRQAEEQARTLLAAALAVRGYTTEHILPKLSHLPSDGFLEETVPSFAAQTVFRSLIGPAKGYTYREPALNPTSPADRASAFEIDLIRQFRERDDLAELTGVHDSGQDRLFYLAKPIRVVNPACLGCHDTPERAPPAMLTRYGSANGFGWQLNEVVAIQLLTVPVTRQLGGLVELTAYLAGGLLLIFVLCYGALTVALDSQLVRPLKSLAAAADTASVSGGPAVVVANESTAELRALGQAIERLRRSLARSMARPGRDDTAL
jgi:HAMP domain-containing protein